MTSGQISIRPGVGMLGLFPHMKYQPWYALSELVDNAIQSFLTNKEDLQASEPGYRLRIQIDFAAGGGSITIKDNAAGIFEKDWERALQVAEPPEDATGLSQFGIGMKAACCWFAREWSLRTVALHSARERGVEFDVPKIVRTREESLEVHDVPVEPNSHYTVIEMTNLYRPVQGRTKGKIREYLGGIYRQFLRDGDVEIQVDGEEVFYDEPGVLVKSHYKAPDGLAHKWRQDVDITLASGRRVTGFVALRSVGQAKQPGLALLYRNKVVTGSGEETYKPPQIFGAGNSFQSQRIFGELHVDDFDVTYTKDALVWHDEEEQFVEALRIQLDSEPWPLIRQAVNHRARVPEEPAGARVERTLERIVSSFTDGADDLPATNSDDTRTEPVDTAMSGLDRDTSEAGDDATPAPKAVDREVMVKVNGETWSVMLRLVADETVSRWLTVSRAPDGPVELTVNQSHPFMRAWCELPSQDLEPVWRVAIALGLAQEMARMGGAKLPGMVTENVNSLLRNVLSRKG